MSTAHLTVVLMLDRRRQRAERVLRSVLEQAAIDRLEILLFDFGHHACPPLPGSDHPAVTVIPMRYPSSIGAVRLEGFRRANAPFVAFLEEHAMAFPGWAGALIDAFNSGDWAGVGAEVHALNPGGLGDALFNMNYPEYVAPAVRGPRLILQGNNSAYRRDAVLGLGPDLLDLLEIESLLNVRLAERGCRLLLEPNARFAHANEHIILTFIEGDYIFSRLFGALRGKSQGWTARQRAERIIGAPLIPFVRAARLMRNTAAKRPALLPLLLPALPAIFCVEVASVCGQTMGLLLGEGHTREQFLFYELNALRDEVD
ncbi:MAG: hypothetical protein JNL34_00305 [Anaerolineae bacterium]|nr:hypothetical protein [Anaerolineae bacterium]